VGGLYLNIRAGNLRSSSYSYVTAAEAGMPT